MFGHESGVEKSKGKIEEEAIQSQRKRAKDAWQQLAAGYFLGQMRALPCRYHERRRNNIPEKPQELGVNECQQEGLRRAGVSQWIKP